jgi:large repetitive protein
LYLNPSRTPALNLIWSQVCSLSPCYGIAWQVTQPLAPGAELTLTSTVGSFAQGYTNWRDRLAAGTTDLYVQADSWNPGNTVGASGDTNLANNLFHIGGLRVTGQNVAGAGADVAIPARPAAGHR